MPKSTKIEFEKRLFQVQGWIVDGVQPALIIKQIITAGWCESSRHAERMLKAAREKWTEVPEAEIADKRKLKVAELQQLKRGLKESWKGTPSAIRAIIEVEKQIIMLEGLNAPQQHIVKGDKDNPIVVKSGIDYSKLPNDVLMAIINAEIKN